MGKLFPILFGILLVVVLVLGGIYLSYEVSGLRNCSDIKAFDKSQVGCVLVHPSKSLLGHEVIVTLRGVKTEGEETYLTVNLPVFAEISVPLRVRAGMVIKDASQNSRKVVALCPVQTPKDIAGERCTLIQPSAISNTLKPGMLVAFGLYANGGFLRQDPYYLKCAKTHGTFLNVVGKQLGIGSFVQFLGEKSCAPLVGDISYK